VPVPGPPLTLAEAPTEVEAVLVEAESADDAVTTLPTAVPTGAVKKRPRVRSDAQSRYVQRLLSNRPGLRTAFILSEILAPPVSLRDNHPS
jgi:hypothetical protein